MAEQQYQSIFRAKLFEDQVILVTGGGTGLGRCIAHELAALGAIVVLAGRRLDVVEDTAAEIVGDGGKAEAVELNIRDQEAVESALADIVSRHGRLDALVNNAGGQYPGPAEDIRPKGWQAVIDTNLNGTWWVTQAAFSQALKNSGGAIVNIVADMWVGMPGMVHTGAARAGIVNLTRSLASEWAGSNVRVNAVAPGPILTGGLGTYPEVFQQKIVDEVSVTPASRLGTESEVSAAVVFLLSPAASFISGEIMRVDGASSYFKNPVLPVGNHAPTPRFDGFHRRPQLGGVFKDYD